MEKPILVQFVCDKNLVMEDPNDSEQNTDEDSFDDYLQSNSFSKTQTLEEGDNSGSGGV